MMKREEAAHIISNFAYDNSFAGYVFSISEGALHLLMELFGFLWDADLQVWYPVVEDTFV